MQVRDVMTQATVTETPSDTLRAAAERMWRQQTGSLLICEQGRITGIITARTISAMPPASVKIPTSQISVRMPLAGQIS